MYLDHRRDDNKAMQNNIFDTNPRRSERQSVDLKKDGVVRKGSPLH